MDAGPVVLFGRRLRELRVERGWTQEQLAEAAEIHDNFVSRLETGAQEPGLIVILNLRVRLTRRRPLCSHRSHALRSTDSCKAQYRLRR